MDRFSTIASGNVESLVESDFNGHSSLKSISSMMTGSNDSFCFRPVTCHEIKDAMDKLNSRKAAGYNQEY